MADHNISIDVQVKNQEALNILKQIRDTLNSIKADNSLKITIQDNFKQVQSDLEGIRKDMNDISQKQLKLDASGFESVVQTLQNGFDDILKKMDEIGKKKTRPRVDKSDIDAATQSAEKLNTALEKVNRTRQMPSAGPGTALDLYSQLGAPRPSQYWGPKRLTGSGPKLIGYSDIIDGVNYTIFDAETGEPLLISGPVKNKLTREELYGMWGGRLGKVATGLDIASGISSALGDFGGGMASAVGGMSSMFNFDTVGTAKRYLTAMATRAITGQIGGIIQRYDIMNTFEDYMELAGVSDSVAKQSLNRVDQSIRGIPIGLDEAAFRLRKYQMYLGDIDLATDFTIGIQKAITAGGASEQMKTTAYTQIDRLLATGKLGQSRQWLSLFNGLGVSLRFLKEELGLDANADLRTVAADLASGAIPVEDFINAIARLSENAGLDKAIEIYKGTIEAWQSNINNAIKRGGQNIMENMNSVMEGTLGFGITGVMKRVRDGIDTVSKDAGNYIQDNPQHVRTISNAITGLLDRVMTLDGGRFVTNIVNNIGGLAKAIGTVIGSFPPGFLESFAAFATTWAGPLSALMKGAQGGLGIVLGVFDRLNKMDMNRLISQITREIERMARVVSKLLSAIPDGLLGNLMAMGLVWGKPLARVISGIATAVGAVSRSLMQMSMGGTGGALGLLISWIVTNPAAAAVLAGVAAGIGAIAFAVGQFNAANEARQQHSREVLGLDEFESTMQQYEQLGETVKQHAKEYDESIASIQGAAERERELVAEIFELYDQLQDLSNNPELKGERSRILKDLVDDIEELHELLPGLDLSPLESLNIDPQEAQNMRDLADAYVNMVEARAKADAAEEAMKTAYSDAWTAQFQKEDSAQEAADWETKAKMYAKAAREVKYEAEQEVLRQFNAGEINATQAFINPRRINGEWYYQKIRLSDATKEAIANLETYATDAQKSHDLATQVSEDSEKLEKKSLERAEFLKEEMRQQENVVDGYKELAENDTHKIISDDAETAAMTIEQTADAIRNSLSDTAKAYQELKEAAEGSLQSQIDLFKELNTESEKGLHDSLVNVQGNVERTRNQSYFSDVIEQWLNDPNNKLTGKTERAIAWAAAHFIETGNNQALGELAGLPTNYTDENGNLTPEYYRQLTKFLEETDGYDVNDYVTNTEGNLTKFQLYSGFGVKEGNKGIEEYETAEAAIAALEGTEESATETATNYGNATQQAADASASVNENDPSGTIEATGEAAEGATGPTEELAGATQQVATNAQQASTNSDSMKGSVIRAGAAALMQSVSMLMFSGSLSAVASQATHAFTQVSALAGAISRLQNKEITIKVNVLGSLGRAAHGGMAGYFASGGNVLEGFPGMASGTDIVPAWLTPGEYVMRRSAVGLFGSRFMDRVNKMDIGGAFDALMTRISNPMGATYNRDNHATVNNYFYGNGGQDYSQRKAYRFVGAL